MAAFFPDKRTRSQLTLPDNLLHLPLDRSPLKDARTRLQSEPPASTTPDAAESDDELLLSPSPSKKRAASPWRANEYASNAAIRSDLPAAKRLRREGGDIEGDYENTVGTSSSDARLATEAPSTSSPDKHRRAQSVPAFPMIDLRNPPGKRQRSRSPSRPLPELQYKRIPLPTIQEPSNSLQQASDTRVDDVTFKTPARLSSFNDLEMSPLTPLPETPAPAGNASTDDSAMDIDDTPRPAPSTAMVPSASLLRSQVQSCLAYSFIQ
ncbi:hypothetical protein BDZ89DRAFT_384030 [Hymenopellis radicata]|nr:hypothetical protein BDZ89DRAFT_384030 [Hymenopellis radicata]